MREMNDNARRTRVLADECAVAMAPTFGWARNGEAMAD
jgi:hypothetical protein